MWAPSKLENPDVIVSASDCVRLWRIPDHKTIETHKIKPIIELKESQDYASVNCFDWSED